MVVARAIDETNARSRRAVYRILFLVKREA